METIVNFATALTVGVAFWATVFALYRFVNTTFRTIVGADAAVPEWKPAVETGCSIASYFATPIMMAVAMLGAANVYKPAPAEFTYAAMEKNPEAGFWARTAAWAALGTGWVAPEVTNRGLYTKAEFPAGEEQAYFVGVPGAGKWYRVTSAVYHCL